ncbi:helix-turn-helix transcriptional regulator [Actinopolyspora saharensis]|uniref:helix-turn-helix transcriptional regulator n=1 Tax=Actinopolyspora saharensis TaxID=995062 RepID=UPI003F675111
MTNLDGLVSAPQAAELLGISVKTLYRNSYVYDDFPRPVKVGRTVLYDPTALHAWRHEHPPRRSTK